MRKVLNLIPAIFSEKEGEKTLHDLIMSSEQKKSLYISPLIHMSLVLLDPWK